MSDQSSWKGKWHECQFSHDHPLDQIAYNYRQLSTTVQLQSVEAEDTFYLFVQKCSSFIYLYYLDFLHFHPLY